eukprot:SAG11_NODE_10034_length_861_cov_1.947507_1_plen_36_part_10
MSQVEKLVKAFAGVWQAAMGALDARIAQCFSSEAAT